MARWFRRSATLWLAGAAIICPAVGIAAGQATDGNKWAIVVGVQRYSERTGFAPLRYAEQDAQAVSELLRDPVRGGYSPGRVKLLTTAAEDPADLPGRGNILAALNLLVDWAQMSPQHAPDTVLLYFSGHGVQEGAKSYLIPVDVTRSDLETTAISLDMVRERLARCGAKKQVVIVDACRFQERPGKAGGELQSVEFARALEEFARAEGRVVLASCSSNQASYEDQEAGHSAFTGILLEGLLGAADADGDGVITLSESYQYLSRELHTWAAKRGLVQHPTLYGEMTLIVPLVRCPKWVEVRRHGRYQLSRP